MSSLGRRCADTAQAALPPDSAGVGASISDVSVSFTSESETYSNIRRDERKFLGPPITSSIKPNQNGKWVAKPPGQNF